MSEPVPSTEAGPSAETGPPAADIEVGEAGAEEQHNSDDAGPSTPQDQVGAPVPAATENASTTRDLELLETIYERCFGMIAKGLRRHASGSSTRRC